jgi:hypothetical protein
VLVGTVGPEVGVLVGGGSTDVPSSIGDAALTVYDIERGLEYDGFSDKLLVKVVARYTRVSTAAGAFAPAPSRSGVD